MKIKMTDRVRVKGEKETRTRLTRSKMGKAERQNSDRFKRNNHVMDWEQARIIKAVQALDQRGNGDQKAGQDHHKHR